MTDVTYTFDLDKEANKDSCVTCVHFESYLDRYQTLYDPWAYGFCLNSEVVDTSLQFGIRMICSLHEQQTPLVSAESL
ncbi:MAG: hypothetical protein EOO39_20880 [Cytophagaceae bacterium]|nr:MAG: hypothetical protein EOO39_20880 [Cytophagaceae bacterium]